MTGSLPLWVAGGGLLFWGWSTGMLALAFPLVVLAVGPQYLRRRFDFATAEFHRALDVCWVLFLGGLLLVYGRETMGNVLRSFARWLPAVFAPALLAQVWSARGRLPASAILPLPWWRRQVEARSQFDVVPPFLVLSLLSASVAGGHRAWFYAGLLGVAGVALWCSRPAGGRRRAALVMLALSGVGGWYVADGIGTAQQEIEARFLNWVTRFRRDEGTSRVAHTAIGRTGDVGGSSRVVLRVRSDGPLEPPARMRVATYSSWRGGSWHAPAVEFEKVEGAGDEWPLDARTGREGAVYVELVREATGGLLALPASTRAVGELAADRVERTSMGVVRVTMGAGVVGYRADLATETAWESGPGEEDRTGVPPAEREALAVVVEELGLVPGMPVAEVTGRLERFFTGRFRYTTALVDGKASDPRAATPVGRFLLGHRAGHCEYFATAGVLLLRQAGVAARYVSGYLVAAGEADGMHRIVRERQAHAWVRVWTGTRWEDFDPTPPGGVEMLAEAPATWGAALWQRWNNVRFAASRWWWLGEKRLLRQAYWLVAPLLLLLLWRLRRVREVMHGVVGRPEERPVPLWPGLDSEWFAVEAALQQDGLGRGMVEALPAWQRRLEQAGWPARAVGVMAGGRRLHERLRFDPRGLDDRERVNLRRVVAEVLDLVAERRRVAEALAATPPEHQLESGPVRVGARDPAPDQIEGR